MTDVDVVHGDCLDVLAGMDACSVDAVVTELPSVKDLWFEAEGNQRLFWQKLADAGYQIPDHLKELS